MKRSQWWIVPTLMAMVLIAAALGWWLRGLVQKPDTPPGNQAAAPDQGDGQQEGPKKEVVKEGLRPLVTILADAPGLAPEEVEALVAFPIEIHFNGMQGVERIRSVSRAGGCIIQVDFEPKTDISQARQHVLERLQRVALPAGVKPMLGPVSPAEDEVLLVGLRPAVEPKTPEERTTRGMDLHTLADHVLRPRLLSVAGVGQVAVTGGIRKQYQIVLDPEALQNHDVTVQQVEDALRKSTLGGAGNIQRGNQEIPLLLRGKSLSLKDLAAIPVAVRGQRPVLLEQVAQVRFGGPDRLGDSAFWTKEGAQRSGGLAVILTVLKQPHARDRDIDLALDQVRQALPPDVKLERQTFTHEDLRVYLQLLPGTSREERDRTARRLEAALLEVAEVQSIWRRGGQGEIEDLLAAADVLELFVGLQRKAERTREQIQADIRKRVAGFPGVKAALGHPVAERFDCIGASAAIAVKVFGPDLQVLGQAAQDIQVRLSKVPGVVDLLIEPQGEREQLQVRFRREEAARHGLLLADLAAVLDTALEGRKVGEVLEGNRRLDLVVMYDGKVRGNPGALGDLLLELPTGGRIPLSRVAEVVEAAGPMALHRENMQRRLVISCNVQGRDRAAVLADIRRALEPVEEKLRKLPGDYRLFSPP